MSSSSNNNNSNSGSGEAEIGTGKTIFVIAVVLGCFAVLYPKIFYHMMFDEKKDKPDHLRPNPHEFGRPPMHGHPAMHMRNQQGKIFHGEEGKEVRRTIDRELKPGPVPGMRPTMGGPGFPQAPRANQGGGTMSILMPIYTTGIVIFFVYTVMKIMFKKNDETSQDMDSSNTTKFNRRFQQPLRPQNIPPEYWPQPPQQPQQPPVVQSKEPAQVEPLQNVPKEDIIKSEPILDSKKPILDSQDPRDEQIRILKERLEETEKAMLAIVSQMTAIKSQIPQDTIQTISNGVKTIPDVEETSNNKPAAKEEVPKRLSENNTDEAKVESEDANSDDEETQSEDSDDDDDEMPNEQEIIENVESVPLLSTSS